MRDTEMHDADMCRIAYRRGNAPSAHRTLAGLKRYISAFPAFMLYIMLLLALAPSAAGSSELLYDSEFITGDTFAVDGTTYEVSVMAGGNEVMIAPLSEFIDLGDCLSTGALEICFKGSGYDDSDNEYYAELEVSMVFPEISFSHEFSSTDLRPGQVLHINVTLENTGSAPVENLLFVQEVPSGMLVDSIGEDMDGSGGMITWTSSLDEEEDVKLTYSLVARSALDEEIQQYVEYHDGYEEQRKFSQAVKISVESPFTMLFSKNTSDEVYLGDLIEFEVEIENDDEEDAEIDSLWIDIPSGMDLEERDPKLSLTGEGLVYSGTLEGDSSEEFNLVARVVSEGVLEPKATATLTRDGAAFDLEEELELEAEVPETGIELRIWEDTDDGRIFEVIETSEEFEGSLSRRLDIYIDNPYHDEITDVEVRIESDYHNLVAHRDSIPGRSSRRVFREDVEFPSVNSSTNDDVNITVTYQTSFGYTHEDMEDFRFTYIPLDQLEIDHELSESRPESGSSVTVSMIGSNPRSSELSDVELRDVVPEDLFRSGTRERTTSFSADEEKTVYEYSLRLPIVPRETEIDIFTSVRYSDSLGDHDYRVPFTFTVYPRSPDITIERSPDRDEVPIGRHNSIDYIIRNDEDYRFEDVRLRFTGGEGIYRIGSVVEELGNINPGRSAEPEESFVVFDEDASPGDAVIEFTDDQGVRHNEEAPSIRLDVTEADTDLPRLSLEISDYELVSTEAFNYTILVTNSGDDDAQAHLVDGERETSISIAAGESASFTREADFDDFYEMLVFPAPYLRFEHDGLTLFAVAQDLNLEDLYSDAEELRRVDDESEDELEDDPEEVTDTEPDETEDEDVDDSDETEQEPWVPDDGTEEEEDSEEEMGRLASFLDWILRLIGIR